MKLLVLAAGYATRMYPLTLKQPKPLLEVAGKPIIEHILDKIKLLEDIDNIYVITNQKFYSNFQNWLDNFSYLKPIKIINDKTSTNEDRLGAIGDISLVIEQEKIQDDLLVIAGDNLFKFGLTDFVNYFKQKNSDIIAARKVDIKLVAGKYGIVEVDENNKIIGFEEKPDNPKSDLAATCIYLFKKNTVSLIKEYLAQGNSKDAPGNFIKWLISRQPVYGYKIGKWFDIGNQEQYKQACEEFSKS